MSSSDESLPIFKRKMGFMSCVPKRIKHYMVGNVLGKGSYGKVYEAWDEETQHICAIKVIKKRHLSCIPGGEHNVQSEVEILSRLKHKCIIHLLDHFTDEEKIYLVFEHGGGGSLKELLERAPNKRLPLVQARKIFEQILDALEYLHTQNIIHRDLKPENMLFTQDGNLKLSDFSVAVEVDKVCTEADRKCNGTPAFQPPELLTSPQKRPCAFFGPKIDIWAAGITLYMMCIGSFPFEWCTVSTLIESISKASYKIPSWVDPTLADLLKGILNKDPMQRLTLQQIKEHPWMMKKLKKEKVVPLCPFVSSFKCDKERKKPFVPTCQCVVS